MKTPLAMSEHVMTAETAVYLLNLLGGHGVETCVGGGWAVDALLGEQTDCTQI